MNRELSSLAEVIDNLPNELQYLGIIKDMKSGEFIFFNNNESNYSFRPELKAIRGNINDYVVLNRFLYNLIGSIEDLPLLQQVEKVLDNKKKELLKDE